ncbi:MAG: calcium-binding protein [Nostocaceae cyanobacterium]|nr:calcium-binding protein [Nostocaceae cyanobacterium]
MSSTVFLEQTGSNADFNEVNATGDALFFNFSQSADGSINSVELEDRVKGGVALGIADFDTTFVNDPTFALLFTEALGIGVDEAFEGKVKIDTKVIANFAVAANDTFSFDFSAESDLSATEIENPDTQYNKANSKVGFLVLDISGNKPKILDYFGIKGKLVSSKQIGNLNIKGSGNVNIEFTDQETDVDGNNGIDSLTGFATGTYEREFKGDTKIAIVKFNESTVKFAGDNLIGNLEDGVIYGTIYKDKLKGSKASEKFYTSLGNDDVQARGGNDIIEGGDGNDKLDGGKGDDSIHGGAGKDRLIGGYGDDVLVGGDGDDVIKGGRGSDTMTGGEGGDTFLFKKPWMKQEHDVITDFESGFDIIKFQGWGALDSQQWFNEKVSNGQISNTNDGVLVTFDLGKKEGQLLLEGLDTGDLNYSDFRFM